MILLRSIIILSILAAGCSSSESDNPKNNQSQDKQPAFPNLISLKQPGQIETAPSKVYVDSARWIDYKGNKALLLSGNLPNGCTYIKEVTHTTTSDTLQISLHAWKPANKMCTQALVPFSYIYTRLSPDNLAPHAGFSVNGKSLSLQYK